jgi:CheY-like chemotaxis protein
MTRILLIDDEEQIRLTIGELLRVTGYDVVVAGDGQEGLDLFQQQTFDLVITDLRMPKKGGVETIRALRSLQPGLKIIATYGGGRISGTDSLVTAQGVGADRLLAKPITLTELRAAVSDVLKAPPDSPEQT